MTAAELSHDIRDDVDYETDDRGNEEKRENRVQEGDAAYPHRGNGDIGGLIAHGYSKRVIHKIPEVGRPALGKLISQFALDDGVVVVEAHVVEAKINMGKEPGEDHRQERSRHVKIDLPSRPAGRVVEHRGHPDETGCREHIDDD